LKKIKHGVIEIINGIEFIENKTYFSCIKLVTINHLKKIIKQQEPMKKIITLLVASVLLFSCDDSKEDVVKEPNKDGGIEASLTTKHEQGYDILTTQYKVWVKGKVEKTIIKTDTLPSLGMTHEEGEDHDGNTQELEVPKDYEFFITVK